MLDFSYLSHEDGTYTLQLQDARGLTFFYPMVKVTDTDKPFLCPAIATYDSIESLPHFSLFKLSSEQKRALTTHNLNHYSASQKVKLLGGSAPCVSALEVMAEELEEMSEKGIAFK